MDPYLLKSIVPNFYAMMESAFSTQDGMTLGWHSTAVDVKQGPLGSGFAEDLNTARRIAIAEAIERSVFRDVMAKMSPGLGLEAHPNTDGFACGFNTQSTMFRALCEAVERWAWSHWIDGGYFINLLDSQPELNPLAARLLVDFDEVNFYRREIPMVVDGKVLIFHFGATIARKGSGVFPGSRVSLSSNLLWQHCLIEASRNFNIFHNNSGRDDVICQRIKFFGSNGLVGLKQIEAATKINWQTPRLKLLSEVQDMPQGIYLWRALCDSFVDWHIGPIERFVY